jgi:hypothetical protein
LKSWLSTVLLALAVLAALAQTAVVLKDYAVPLLGDKKLRWQSPAWERAAVVQEGEDFAGYIAFLRSRIPEHARVILPPNDPPRSVAHMGFMQYYLFPRDIHNCGVNEIDDCILRVTGKNTYVVGLPDFPPRALAELSKHFIQYKDDLGVFAPK